MPALRETFAAFPAGTPWQEGVDHGCWRTVYDGYGRVSVEAGSNGPVLRLAPKAATCAAETHAALVIAHDSLQDLTVTVQMRTVLQLRTGSAPSPWEVGWVLWHVVDPSHFYYVALKTNGWELGKADPAVPGGQRFLATGSAPASAVGTDHQVLVRQHGGTMSLDVDGTRLVTRQDEHSPYLEGSAGLYVEDAVLDVSAVTVAGL